MKLLLTGATGNVGRATLAALLVRPTPHLTVVAGVRELMKEAKEAPRIQQRVFDFEAPATWAAALSGIDTVFLLRPPQLADVTGTFAPLVAAMVAAGVGHVVLLSVQGAENNAIIPHRRIEKLLLASGLGWTFLRPSYFMQNLTTTLRVGLETHHRIRLPAGQTPFRWIDVADIGRVAAVVLRDPAAHTGQAYDLTGDELTDFGTVCQLISRLTGVPVRYEPIGPLRFLWEQHRAHQPLMYGLVLVMLHWLPRFFAPPPAADTVRRLTGQPPGTLAAFIEREVAPLLRRPQTP